MMSSDAPDLTVITPVLNGAAHIEACLDSTLRLARAGLRVEHIVVDGGSTDATLQRLAARPELHILVRPGEGAHDSCNTAARAARGGVIALLMADDTWTDSAGAAFAEAIGAPGWDVALFPAELHDGGEVRILPSPNRLWGILRRYPGLNSALIAAPLVKMIGFNTSFPAVHDRLFMVEALACANAVWLGQKPVARINVHPGSRTMSPLRDVAKLKAELNGLAGRLLGGGHVGIARSVFALWCVHTALSLAGEGVLANLRGWGLAGRGTLGKPVMPDFWGLTFAMRGACEMTLGADALFEAEQGHLRRCRALGLATPEQLSDLMSTC